MHHKEESASILYVSSFPPRECGIATFTKDLVTAMDKKFNPRVKAKILAMNNGSTNTCDYPEDVIFQVDESKVEEHIEAAQSINKTDSIKLVNIQFEFWIFGVHCEHLIQFIEELDKPVVITFHSVVPNPDNERRKVVRSIAKKAACLIVMNKLAIGILENDYGLSNDIFVIPHGIHPVPYNSSAKGKNRMGYKDRIILSTFGMMRATKGIEYVIRALPEVTKKFPNVLYLIIGETHPNERRKRGENYRNFLEKKVKELGLQEHVKFCNRYLKLSEIKGYLEATDIYIAPELNPDQITSGTISYAMGAGRAVISTPSLHAKDAVTPERGLLAKFRNQKSFSDAIIRLLSNPTLKERMGKNAYSYAQDMTWPNVASQYKKVFDKYMITP